MVARFIGTQPYECERGYLLLERDEGVGRARGQAESVAQTQTERPSPDVRAKQIPGAHTQTSRLFIVA